MLGLGASPRGKSLSRFVRGLLSCHLLEDLRQHGPYTLMAPINDAWDALPWPWEDFIFARELAEARIDVLESCVVRGLCTARRVIGARSRALRCTSRTTSCSARWGAPACSIGARSVTGSCSSRAV